MKQMTAIIEQDEEGFFVAHCPGLKGCWSQGRTEEEAMGNLREAMEGWLEAEEARACEQLKPGQHVREVSLT